MSGSGPSTAREALLAELLGDAQKLLNQVEGLRDELERAGKATQASAQTLQDANARYRSLLDESIARTRKEFAATLAQASSDAMTKQSGVLKDAAVVAIRQAAASENARHARPATWRVVAMAAAIGAIVGVVAALTVVKLT